MSEARREEPSHLTLYALIALMTFLWSLNYIVSKIALRELPALLIAGLRTALAGTMILPVYAWVNRKRGERDWAVKDVPFLLYLSFFGVALNQLFFVLGVGYTSVAHSALMIGMTPLMVLTIAAIIGLEQLRWGRLIGMAVALFGVAVLQFAPGASGGATVLGDLIVLLAGLTFAIFTVSGKRVSRNFTSLTLNTFAYVGGGLMLLPVTVWFLLRTDVSKVSLGAWLGVVYMAAFPSVLCYLIYYYALTYIPASRASAFSYLQPVLATLMAIPILGEHVTGQMIAGGVLVLFGVFLTERL